ncbi:MAG TPA: DUF4369 domain-containing protein, partial [Saprospiraceae bacterium]|nr:DUF4369 domain-containing protein [Saprospiraceae bacterium]
MKYRIIFFSLLLSSFLAAQKDSCHIRVQIEGFNGGKVKLIGVYADNNYFADSAFVDEQGRFEFKRKSPLKPGYFYIILPDYSNFHMMVDHEQFFSMKAKKEDVIGTMEIKGSIDNVLLYESLRLQVRHDKEIDSLNTLKKTLAANDPAQVKIEQAFNRIASERKEQLEKFQKNHPNTLFSKFKVAGQNPELVDVRLPDGQPDRAKQLQYFRNAFWDNVDLADLRMLHTPVMVNKLKRYITELTVQQPDSIIRVADMI